MVAPSSQTVASAADLSLLERFGADEAILDSGPLASALRGAISWRKVSIRGRDIYKFLRDVMVNRQRFARSSCPNNDPFSGIPPNVVAIRWRFQGQ